MINAGLTLMLAGMATVFVFLSLMILAILAMAFLARKHTSAEHQATTVRRKAKNAHGRHALNHHDDPIPLAVITAGIAAFEQDHAAG